MNSELKYDSLAAMLQMLLPKKDEAMRQSF